MEPSVPALRAFIAVAREKHFARAADALHMSGPALSQLVKRLENNIGFELFERSTRTVALTEAGEQLLPMAARVVAAADELETWRRSWRTRERSALRLAFTVNGAGPLMHRILRAARDELPETAVQPRQVEWRDLPGAVLSGSCDVAIARGPRDFDGVEVVPILDEPFIVAVPSEHPFADRESVDMAEVREEPLVRPDIGPGAGPRPVWLGGPHPDGHTPPSGPLAATLEEALDFVQMGEGLLVTGSSVGRLFPREGVAYVSLTGLAPGQIVLLHRPGVPEPRVDAFLRVAVRAAAQHQQSGQSV